MWSRWKDNRWVRHGRCRERVAAGFILRSQFVIGALCTLIRKVAANRLLSCGRILVQRSIESTRNATKRLTDPLRAIQGWAIVAAFMNPVCGTVSRKPPVGARTSLSGTLALLLLFGLGNHACGQTLPLPPREADALSGSQFVQVVTPLSRKDREDWILAQMLRGNVPDFLRTLTPIAVNASITGTRHTAIYHVAPDYLAIGSDADYFLCPMTPLLAQRICDALGYTMPTRRMVNQIWTNAPVKLSPAPISPSPQMTTVPVFDQHNSMVRTQRSAVIGPHPLGELVSGTKKDVVISQRIYGNFANPNITRPVVIYGWHHTSGAPIQPLYNGHVETYADYSHGIRLVQRAMTLNGQPETVTNICASPILHPLLSDEGRILTNRYSIDPLPPTILSQPETQRVVPGEPASFSVVAAGDPPLAYQWQHQGTNLPGATLPVLELLDPQSADEGSYRVLITNSSGSIFSSPSSLMIITSTPRLNLIQRYPNDRVALGLSNTPAARYLAQASAAFVAP